MIVHLDLETLLVVAERAIGEQPMVRDYGLLESALARPRTSVFGQDAYPSLPQKAAALLHSLVSNHALVDGNNRLDWQAMVVFCYLNGSYVDAPDDDAYELVVAVASGAADELNAIAERIEEWSRPV